MLTPKNFTIWLLFWKYSSKFIPCNSGFTAIYIPVLHTVVLSSLYTVEVYCHLQLLGWCQERLRDSLIQKSARDTGHRTDTGRTQDTGRTLNRPTYRGRCYRTAQKVVHNMQWWFIRQEYNTEMWPRLEQNLVCRIITIMQVLRVMCHQSLLLSDCRL